jgi:cell division protein FtsZ
MMGTGEASGEGRAMAAAEAAISNPLLDETSMRGARGLLISITGGRYLTLFEVDEAATRIREEVDSDANIILGATFEESLEGIIRVSVVATGIDRAAQAEMDRGEQGRVQAVSRPAPIQAPVQPAARQPVAAATAPRTAMATPRAPAAPHPATPVSSASAMHPGRVVKGGVAIEPFQPAAAFDDKMIEEDFRSALEDELQAQVGEYIPPAPEMPDARMASARMPDVEDFPPMVQAEMQGRAAPRAPAQEERGPIGLLRKLAHGFGVREEVHEAPEQPPVQPVRSEAQAQAVRSQPVQQPASGHGRVDDNPFAPRRAGLDRNGRIMASERPLHDDEQLEIPAFLRRQSS